VPTSHAPVAPGTHSPTKAPGTKSAKNAKSSKTSSRL
jgi:hypothetical protein